MGRTLLASLLPAAVVALAWARLEDPPLAGPVVLVAALALAPGLARAGAARALAVVGAALGTTWVAFGAEPWEVLPFRDERVVAPVAESLGFGVGDFYRVVLPFDPTRRPEMEAVLLLAIFGFVCALSLLVAARRPLGAGAVTVAGACWPATLLGDGAVGIGAFVLAATLWIPLFLRARTGTTLALGAALGALVVAGAAWTSSATTFSRDAALRWETWDFSRTPARALGVRFIWEATYEPIQFPTTPTVVLRVKGPERAQYWRASTLDTFINDRWFEDLTLLRLREARGALARGPLAPPEAENRKRWTEQAVEVRALVDDRLVAAGTPVSLDARAVGSVFAYAGGVLRATAPLEVGTRYRVWSHVPDPSPADLASAPAEYPPAARRFLDLWGKQLPPFGAPDRDATVRRLLADPSYADFGAYAPLYEEAKRVTSDAATPYASVLALEAWFRQRGGFRYSESPPRAFGTPPLVHFVRAGKAGYCQHYAGAMAVMLRFLGVPARVAVGFTSGVYADGGWRISDRNAHAWVEVWFRGQGWVPFDPTPGRGRFSGMYSFASDSQEAVAALQRGQLGAAGQAERGDVREPIGELVSPGGRSPSLLAVAFLVAALGAAVLAVVKWLVRRGRYLTIQPRLIAAASRKELEAFLRDQGIPVAANATLEHLSRAVRRELGVDAGRYFELAARGRFGPPRDARPAAQSARAELRGLLARARSELSLWARVRGFVSLRSLRGWEG